jgi:hypothetical protein
MISSIGRRVEFPGQDHGDWAGEGVATNASLIVYADADPRQVLRSSPAMDRPAARDLYGGYSPNMPSRRPVTPT